MADEFRQAQKKTAAKAAVNLLLAEGHAVGTLIHGGVGLMGAHQNAVQGAIVFGITVVSTGLYGAFDALVCIAVHRFFLLYFGF